ncbi:hypothetical protein MRX96_029841 [Rhipicephalus microplus]
MSVVEGDGGEVEAARSRKGHISCRRPPVNKWKRSPALQSAPSTGFSSHSRSPASFALGHITAALQWFGFHHQRTPLHKRTLFVPRRPFVMGRFGDDENVGIYCGSTFGEVGDHGLVSGKYGYEVDRFRPTSWCLPGVKFHRCSRSILERFSQHVILHPGI